MFQIRKITLSFYHGAQRNKRLCYGLIIFLFIGRFFYLNYINIDSGELCSGRPGVQLGCDSYRYLGGADNILQHQPLVDKQNDYPGYVFLIAGIKYAGLSLYFLVAIQLLLAIIAAIALYHLVKHITGNIASGLIAAGFYLINPFIAQWHAYVFTESLYSSMLVILAWSVNMAIIKCNLKYYLLYLLVGVVTASIRPNGWIAVPVSFILLIIYSKINLKVKLGGAVIVLIIFFFGFMNLAVFKNAFKSDEISKTLIKGEIIWGYHELHLNMHQGNYSENMSLTECVSYVVIHPLLFMKLAALRVGCELLPIYRPWLSIAFILRFLLWMLPAYILAVAGSISYRRVKASAIILVLFLTHIFIIAVSFSDREFRFLVYLLPLIYVMAGCGFYSIWRAWLKHSLMQFPKEK